ncbi:MAG: phosphoribosylformylglycinamidine synthase subunit PurL, partial [Chloroflexales bacterium]|nr:phosphoribosylformylglycinamidine synthase subunit PurL [Chloroflexales bacterium]
GGAERLAFYSHLLAPPVAVPPHITRVPLRAADDDELMRISREGILALDLHEMRAIRNYYSEVGHDPTDGELETIAQTWSEHCSHKTFKARVKYRVASDAVQASGAAHLDPALYSAFHLLQQDCEIDSLIRTFLMVATDKVLEQRNHSAQDWVLSAFVDNAGIIAFTDDYEVSFKVETHNHPSALEPFGGANTGVGGVIRDVLGVSALPIANTDILCFGPPDVSTQTLASGVLHPRRVCAGVVAGVRDYGNKLGIPTVNGAVLFDPGYTANPLVFCGTVGLAPRGAHPRNVQPGDAIVVLGGRTGRDGIHGATFSSEELSHTTAAEVGSAVQIGDPITEKKTLDVLLQARDRGLYSAITDCGAGGLSSAVGEMGAETGATVELERTPLKYAGLQPWEIWLSEAQERMVLAAPPQHLTAFLELCRAEDVEATAIGHFTNDKLLRVTHSGQTLVELDMGFLHDGRPQRVLDAIWSPTSDPLTARPAYELDDNTVTSSTLDSNDLATILLSLLTHPNIASKERIIRTYDHEVGGATVIKPLVGLDSGGPGDAAVLQPLRHSSAGLALGCAINPRYGRIDPYWMALACVDEALRNVVAVGGDPQRTAILDNFCWGDPRQPDRMAGLVRAAAGCYDAAVAFGTPFISGKDSLNNEYRDAQGVRVAIPPTLLISALAYVPDVRQTLTMDLKEVGNIVYLLGATRNELAGSYALDLGLLNNKAEHSDTKRQALQLPRVDLAAACQTFTALHQAIRAGLVRACHDLSEGGLAVAAAEMAFAGMRGLELDLSRIELSDRQADIQDKNTSTLIPKLFSETPSRFLVETRPQDAAAFEATLIGVTWVRLGVVTAASELRMLHGDADVLQIDLAALKAAWQRGLEEIEL